MGFSDEGSNVLGWNSKNKNDTAKFQPEKNLQKVLSVAADRLK